MNYCIFTTYNRQQQIEQLTRKVSDIFDGEILVYDDGSDYAPNIVGTLHRYKYNHGKRQYWQLFTDIFQGLRGKHIDKFWILPDDVTIQDDFFTESIRLWDSIIDDRKICLSTGHNHNRHYRECWTYFTPVKMGEVVRTQWNDLCFMAERSFLEALNYHIEQPLPEYDYRSSGVGRYISRKLHKDLWNLYHVDKSLVEFPANETRMHLKEKV